MADNRQKNKKWINIDTLPKYKQGRNIGCVDWESSVGKVLSFKYNDIEGEITIVENINGQEVLILYYSTQIKIKKSSLKKGALGGLFGIGGIYKEDIEQFKTERLGEIQYNDYGIKLEIVDYKSAETISVRINDDYTIESSYQHFKEHYKDIRTLYDKTICGVGYIGIGNYPITNEGTPTKCYDAWRSMIRRCYAHLENCKSYEGVEVCKEWHCFQKYAEWYEENYYSFRNETMQVDKDIIDKHSKLYSPQTCLIVPNCINGIFIKNKSNRGDCPIGVYEYGSKELPYTAQCGDMDKGSQIRLGQYATKEEAFKSYKTYKEQYIKRKAEEFKEEIPLKLYEAMINYVVDIED